MTLTRWLNEFETAGRVAGKSGTEIALVVDEVRSHCMDGAEDPYDSFGTPEEYLSELGWGAQALGLGLRRGRIASTAAGFVGGLLLTGSAWAWIEGGLFGVNVVNIALVPIAGILIGLMVDGGRRLLAEREVAALLGLCLVLISGTSLGIALGLIPVEKIVILPKRATLIVGGALVLSALLGHWACRRERGRVGAGHSSRPQPPQLSIVNDNVEPATRVRPSGRPT